MKRTKSLFIVMLLLVAMILIPNAVNAASNIENVTIDFGGYVPVAGEPPKDIVINSEEYTIVDQGWYEYDEHHNVTTNKVNTFEYGKTYYFKMYMKANTNYEFVSTVIDTMNIDWDYVHRSEIIENKDNQYYGCASIEGDYTIGKVHAEIKIEGNLDIIPVVGKTPQYLNIPPSDEFEVYQEWCDEEFNPVTIFEEGKQYFYMLTLDHKTAPAWDDTSTLEVTNIVWDYTLGGGSYISSGTLNFAGLLSPIKEYEITVNSVEGVIIGQDGPLVGLKGYNRNLHILAEDGYRITSVKVNGVEQTLPLENDELVLNNIQEDINVVIEAEVEEENENGELKFFEDSENQKFIIGTDQYFMFILDNNRGSGKVLLDGKELEEEKEYLWHFLEGVYPSIKFSEDYIKTLELGEHTIKIILDDGREVETTFTITEPGMDNEGTIIIEGTKDEGINNEEIKTDTNSNNPATGDNIAIYFATLIVSILAIGAIILIKNKNNK